MNKKKLLVIGGNGNMGSAIIAGLKNTNLYNITIAQKDFDYTNLDTDIILLAVKPQIFQDILPRISGYVKKSNPLVISIAAGITIDTIRLSLSENSKVIRAMPNTPILIGEGVTGIIRSSNISDDDFQTAKQIFSASSKVVEIEEEQIHSLISLSGSSPAYIYMFIEAMISSGIKNGMKEEESKLLVCNTIKGAADMVLENSDSPKTLRENVCSKGGTTIAAVNSLQENNFHDIIIEAMQKCVDRSKEMSKQIL